MKADVRIGDYYFRLAGEIGRAELGLRGMRWGFRSITAEQLPPFGQAGIENVREEDLTWILTSFAGGEGQRVFTAGDPLSERRYDRNKGIDISDSGQLRLAKAMERVQLAAGVGLTTVQGSSFADITGVSTVIGDDRRMNDEDDVIGYEQAMAAGFHQVDFYGYLIRDTVFEAGGVGNIWSVTKGQAAVTDTDRRMKLAGDPSCRVVSSKRQFDVETPLQITAYVKGFRNPGEVAKAKVVLELRNEDDDGTIKSVTKTLTSANGDYDEWRTLSFQFTAVSSAFRKYRYRIGIESDTGRGVDFDRMVQTNLYDGTMEISAYDGATPLASNEVEFSATTSQLLGTLVFSLAAPITVSLRFKALGLGVGSGGSFPVADKIGWSDVISLSDARLAEYGMGGNIWLVDHSAGATADVWKWDQVNSDWDTVATIGGAGATAIAMAHSDTYEYILLADGNVWRLDGATGTQYTQTITGAVGIAVAVDRLWVLAESAAGGVDLYRFDLDQTAGLPLVVPAITTSPLALATTPDTSIIRRVTGTPRGVAFFANRATGCTIWEWNEGTTARVELDTMKGFKARGIFNGGGFTYLIGELSKAGGGTEAALFTIDHTTTPATSERVRLVFEREGDPDSWLQDIDLRGDQLYILAHVASSPPTLRLWRVSLQDPGGLFCEQEVEIGTGKVARSMAISDLTRVMVADEGGPFVQQSTYIADATPFHRSSLFSFAFLQEKRLASLVVDGEFPDGTSVEVWYSTDGAKTFELAGVWAEPEAVSLADIDNPILFRHLVVEIRPRTTDSDETPVVYALYAGAVLTTHGEAEGRNQFWDLILLCTKETSSDHISGQQVSGASPARYIRDLATQGTLVELEDFYFDPDAPEVHIVELRDPQWYGLAPGEGLMRVQAVQR
jgi:hypothetical protein